MKINLSFLDWKIKGFWPYDTDGICRSDEFSIYKGITHWMNANVPGSVHKDLYQNGFIQDPYYGLNGLQCEWVEHKWWVYRTEFSRKDLYGSFPSDEFADFDEALNAEQINLRFKGVDYDCIIYFNGQRLCEHSNLYHEFTVNIKPWLKDKNYIAVVIKSVPDEEMQMGVTSQTKTQKPRFGYKWDFCNRLVNMGIWDDVYLEFRSVCRFKDYHIRPLVQDDCRFLLDLWLEGGYFSSHTLQIDLYDHSETCVFHGRMQADGILYEGMLKISKEIIIDNPNLWYCTNEGEQPLYRFLVTLYNQENNQADQITFKSALAKIQFVHNQDSPEDALNYTLEINGKSIYIKGVNWIPIDQMYGAITAADYRQMLTLVKEMNVNLVRVWGGGLVEKDAFYDICDELGLIVWQDFTQSSSGTDSVPCELESYLEDLKVSVLACIQKVRNHICHAVYTGGNELVKRFPRVPIDYTNPNIQMIKQFVEKYDSEKYYLPSTPSGPTDFFIGGTKGTRHDVHGGWNYMGVREHYNAYGEINDSLLHSECGSEGMCCKESAAKFLPPKDICVTTMQENLTWKYHGEWWCTYLTNSTIFGIPRSFEQFISMSQYFQSEGIRFIVEANRRRAFRNSGSIIWQFNEPWPNVSCSTLVDYYRMPKSAYFAVKRAYAPLNVTLYYRSLIQAGKTDVELWCFHDGTDSCNKDITLNIRNTKGEILSTYAYTTIPPSNGSKKINDLQIDVPLTDDNLFFIEIIYDDVSKSFLFTQSEIQLFKEVPKLSDCRLEVEKHSNGYYVKNTGSHVCVGLTAHKTFLLDNGFNLFPNQKIFIPARTDCNHNLTADDFEYVNKV